jgi:ubiquinone/menaquinone biosynthesis C-methylase UbiE
MFEHNYRAYRASRIVQHYRQLSQLQPAERTILNLLRHEWPQIKMLDIGVGGGRTTQYFSKLAQDYVGIDYSDAMIAACQQRYAGTCTFQVVDARDMQQFPDNTFDFILFSFNGLDVLPHCDRLTVLQEVSRIGKPGGYFCFSSHNLQAMEREFNWRTHLRLNPLETYTNLIMFALLRGFNRSLSPQQLKQANYQVIQDESHNFGLQQYYIRPQAQVEQLAIAFEDIKIYSWKSGLELKTLEAQNDSSDLWLYYLCRIKGC